jgi:hypothetical protein
MPHDAASFTTKVRKNMKTTSITKEDWDDKFLIWMSMMVYAIAVLCIFCLLFISITKDPFFSALSKLMITSLWVCLGLFLVFAMYIKRKIYYLYIPEKSVLIDETGVIRETFIDATYVSKKEYHPYFLLNNPIKTKKFGLCYLISCTQQAQRITRGIEITAPGTPIRVRKFEYLLIIVRGEGVDSLLKLHELIRSSNLPTYLKKTTSSDDFVAYAEYLADECIERANAKLSHLYNPRDITQQQQFRDIFNTTLAEVCGEKNCFYIGAGSGFKLI